MKTRVLTWMVLGLFVVGLLGLAGCSKDDDPDPLNVTGTWTIVPIGDATMTAVLTHAGTTITGTVSDASSYAQTISGSTTATSGSLRPRDITLTVTFSDGRVSTLTGDVSNNNNSMDGRYNDTQGGSDVWTATREQ
jgi:hypothetical protein